MDISLINEMIDKGYISKKKHPDADLYILNYTKSCQYDQVWNKATIACRGLIVDGNWNVVARPFKKFFTLDQLQGLRNHVHNLYGVKYKDIFKWKFTAYDKLDGSLGIAYPLGDRVYIATRGSFESEMAIRASKMLEDIGYHKLSMWPYIHGETLFDHYSFMFEIIYPENRIVVDYGADEKLVLLAMMDKYNNSEVKLMGKLAQFETAKPYPHIKTIDDLEKERYDGREGYVLVFENGFRLKFKFEEYKRLHWILTGVTEKGIWEQLKEGNTLSSLLQDVPDEFYDWVKSIETQLLEKYREIEEVAKDILWSLQDEGLSRKEMAERLHRSRYKKIVFSMLNNKDYSQIIWRLVRPKGQ